MAAPRKLSEQPDPHHRPPQCPLCRDSSFVKDELVVSGRAVLSYWTCSSCLMSWPAPAPRMAKVDLRR